RKSAHTKLVQLVSGEARSGIAQTRVSSVLRRVSGPPIHARRVARLLGEGRHLPSARAKFSFRAGGRAFSRRFARRCLRWIDQCRSREFETALSLLRFAPARAA